MGDESLVLQEVDADIAQWFVRDGQLSDSPLSGPLSESGRELRERRRAAVAALEAAGGRDPWPTVLRPPTEAQQRGYEDHVEHLTAKVEQLELRADRLKEERDAWQAKWSAAYDSAQAKKPS